MSGTIDATTRTRLRRSLIASIVALATILTGCSAGTASDDYPGDPINEGEYGYAEPGLDAGANVRAADAESSAESPQAATADRDVITTGVMYMTVDDPIAAADHAVAIVRLAGGRIDTRSETAADDYNGGSASLTLRIPTDKLDAVLTDVRKLGVVDELSTDSWDVTNQVIDLEARISTLRASTLRIQGLLADAKGISEIITLENELSRRQAELEGLEARLRGFEDQTAMSTIYLSLTTEPVIPPPPEPEPEGPQNFWEGLQEGWDILVSFLSSVATGLGVALPTLVLIALMVAFVVIPLRIRRRTRAKPEAETAASTPQKSASKAKAVKEKR